jgi:hypothetical protein
MTARLEMLERMRVRRILAAPDMAARQADAKLVPLRADGEALLAAARMGGHRLHGACMLAGLAV